MEEDTLRYRNVNFTGGKGDTRASFPLKNILLREKETRRGNVEAKEKEEERTSSGAYIPVSNHPPHYSQPAPNSAKLPLN